MFPVTIRGEGLAVSREVNISGGGQWHIPEEAPVAFVYNRRNYAVMMATPDDLVDFAVGFSLTEEVIKTASDIQSLDILLSEKGADLRFKISNDALEKIDIVQRRRNIVGSASCGICGLENAETLFRVLPRVSKTRCRLDDAAMKKAISHLSLHQPINSKTHSNHAAAWTTMNGDIQIVREDVGRHNALDKLLGAMALAETDVRQGFVLMSSRCSYEIVEKAARRGVMALVSVSGPTAFALRKAEEANMSLYARAGSGAVELLG